MSEEIICGECAKIYRPSEIEVLEGEDFVSTLEELHSKKATKPERGRFGKALLRTVGVNDRPEKPELRPDPTMLGRYRAYTFLCPEGDEVDGNPGSQFPLAILGATGSSKSHMLPALICEMQEMGALRRLGIRLSAGLYPSKKLKGDIGEVYQHCHRLPATKPGQVFGPFGYRLRTGADADGRPYENSLLLFDIAGEDLGEIARIADAAAYLVLCKALIVLIDPTGFMPTDFASGPINPRAMRKAVSDLRAEIRVLADALNEVWDVASSREVPVPICFAISKADAVHWPDDFDWESQTDHVTESVEGGVALSDALAVFSEATKQTFSALGGELVLDEIEECFNPELVRFVPVSATTTMPLDPPDAEGNEWVDDPEPNGIALALLNLLERKGMVAMPTPVVAGDG